MSVLLSLKTANLQEFSFDRYVGGVGHINLTLVLVDNAGVGLQLHLASDGEEVCLLVGELEGQTHGGGEADVDNVAVVHLGVVEGLSVLETSGGGLQGWKFGR